MSLDTLTIADLAQRCQAESAQYAQTGQANERHCFELFRRALVERLEPAWQAIYAQYQALVHHWILRYSRFPHTNEEADFFVNEAFARLWRSGSKPDTASSLDSLGKCLSFLRTCVWSAIEDHLRKVEKDALKQANPLESYDRPAVENKAQTGFPLDVEELRAALWETVQDDDERLVAEESWVYGFTPRKIQARHPDLFETTQAVSQIKRNIIKRLRRRFKGSR